MKSGGGSFKHGNKPSDFMKDLEFDQRQYYQLRKISLPYEDCYVHV
jgi:hypothetical protein